jgi:predicted DNA binding CopG/RHH family protein
MANKLKPFPKFASDAEAERFVETTDLSQYDLMAGALPRDQWFAQAEELYKDARITLRLPQAVVDAYKARAAARSMPYQRLMRTRSAAFGRNRRTPNPQSRRASWPRSKAPARPII